MKLRALTQPHLWEVGYNEGVKARRPAGLSPDPSSATLSQFCAQAQYDFMPSGGPENLTQWGYGFQAGCTGSS